MKVVILFVFVIGIVYGEYCVQDSTSCANEVCTVGMVPTCDAGFCTCIDKPSSSCTSSSDCVTSGYFQFHHCDHEDRQCDDGECECKGHHHGDNGNHGDHGHHLGK